MIEIPLYRLEAARRVVESMMFDPAGCCGEGCERHAFPLETVPGSDPEYRTLIDLLDHAIEVRRRVNDAHRVTVATGGNREAQL